MTGIPKQIGGAGHIFYMRRVERGACWGIFSQSDDVKVRCADYVLFSGAFFQGDKQERRSKLRHYGDRGYKLPGEGIKNE